MSYRVVNAKALVCNRTPLSAPLSFALLLMFQGFAARSTFQSFSIRLMRVFLLVSSLAY